MRCKCERCCGFTKLCRTKGAEETWSAQFVVRADDGKTEYAGERLNSWNLVETNHPVVVFSFIGTNREVFLVCLVDTNC